MPTGVTTEIAAHHIAAELRKLAKGDLPPAMVKRMLAISNALDGLDRKSAAEAVGLERQALRDAVLRYNAEGLDGLRDRPRTGRAHRLTAKPEAALSETIIRGPDPEKDGISTYKLDVAYTDRGMSKLVKRLGMSRQRARPHQPDKDDAAQAAFKGAP